jgi:hypothetical protein
LRDSRFVTNFLRKTSLNKVFEKFWLPLYKEGLILVHFVYENISKILNSFGKIKKSAKSCTKKKLARINAYLILINYQMLAQIKGRNIVIPDLFLRKVTKYRQKAPDLKRILPYQILFSLA